MRKLRNCQMRRRYLRERRERLRQERRRLALWRRIKPLLAWQSQEGIQVIRRELLDALFLR